MGYHGRASSLATREMEEARQTAQKARVERERKESPIYWIKSSEVNEEVFSDVLNIFFQVFSKNPKDVIDWPDLEEVNKSLEPGGLAFAEWEVFGANSAIFEVRSKLGRDGSTYLRFKASQHKGSPSNADLGVRPMGNFQSHLDEYLLSENLAVLNSNVV